MSEAVAYKILGQDEFAAWQRDGIYTGSSADEADGFIHLSAGSQVASTVERYYRDQLDLVLAAIDLPQLGNKVRWEPASNGQLYPHVYGSLPIASVTASMPLSDGLAKLQP